MNKQMLPVLAVFVVGAGLLAGCKKEVDLKRGEALFQQHCAVCHPGGGNIINPKKTLAKNVREANGVKTAADIIGKMRNPGPGMNKFDEATIPDKDATAIAEYILATFK